MQTFYLPKELEKYRNQLAQTLKPCLKIKELDKEPELWGSKFGGKPYLPKDFEYPISKTSNEPLMLLAQINFGEIPYIEPFPKKGILQFYISDEYMYTVFMKDDKGNHLKDEKGDLIMYPDRHLWGMNEKNKTDQRNFRIIYHAEVIKDKNKLITDFSFLPEFDIGPKAGKTEFAIEFEKHYDFISGSDYNRYTKYHTKEFEKALYDYYCQFGEDQDYDFELCVDGDKIGGYHLSSNDIDNRYFYFKDEETVLLFQMDGCGIYPHAWGDGGRAQFFIMEKDLKNLDFSNVLYSWDCT